MIKSDKTFIYILKLENNKYYIGRTSRPQLRIPKHYSSYGSAWTNLHKPEETLEVIPNCDSFDEDKITKQYMNKYGIDNVRGGSYCQINLTEHQKQFIKREIQNVNNVCYNCGDSKHFINQCPEKIKNIEHVDFFEKKQYEDDFVGIKPTLNYSSDDCDTDSLPDREIDNIKETKIKLEIEDDKYINSDIFDYDKYIEDIDYNKNSIFRTFEEIEDKIINCNILEIIGATILGATAYTIVMNTHILYLY